MFLLHFCAMMGVVRVWGCTSCIDSLLEAGGHSMGSVIMDYGPRVALSLGPSFKWFPDGLVVCLPTTD